MNNFIFEPKLGVCKTDAFSRVYPVINKFLNEEREWEECRDGKVKEILDFKTIVTNPYRRLVGGHKRCVNPFFLFAEAMWIFCGRKDVKFLTLFNKNMAQFSDDGRVFHAPYGFRLRHWGVRSEDKFHEDNLHAARGYDQIADAIRILENNPNSRQVVLSIWNPEFDLGAKTRDIPCNDLLMLKIRDGKLITTIQNRSNDLHWGLPTNLFQFSFLTELIAACLNIELGTQTHNSQSLHVYDWNDLSNVMLNNSDGLDLYDVAEAKKIDFKFTHDIPSNRLREIDYYLNLIINNVERVSRGVDENQDEIKSLMIFSDYLYRIYRFLLVYLNYKKEISKESSSKADEASKAADAIWYSCDDDWRNWDVSVLATNWFATKITNNNHIFLGKL